MKKYKYLAVSILILLSCTSPNNKNDQLHYTFNKNKEEIIILENENMLPIKNIIELQFSDSTIIDKNPIIIPSNDTFLVYSKNTSSTVMVFNSKGKFLNHIGMIGNGPGEFPEIEDVSINKIESNIEILSRNSIYKYTNEGKFIEAINVEFPISSFTIDNLGNYWIYKGNNKVSDNYKIYKLNNHMKISKKYLPQDSDLLPMIENNFSKSNYITFRESLNNQLYTIQNGELKESYTIDFGNYSLPSNTHENKDIISTLKKSDHCIIKNYLENNKYIYLQIILNRTNRMMPEIYHWIINKYTNKEFLFKLDTDKIPFESYLYYPQYLTSNNHLLFMGFMTTQEINYEKNPSIVEINLNDLEDKF